MQRFPSFLFASALVFLALLALDGCEREKPAGEPVPNTAAYHDPAFPLPQFPPGRRLDTVMSVSLDGSGRPDYVVTSLGHDSAGYTPPDARADLVQIFTYDSSARRYNMVLADTMLWISGIELRDITGDHIPELILPRSSGGNDVVASIGMSIYSGDGGRIHAILQREDGFPELKRLPRVETEALLVYEEYYPDFFAHAEAEPYVSDILAFRRGAFVSISREQADFFRERAGEKLKEYQQARTAALADTSGLNAIDSSGISGMRAPSDSLAPPDSLDATSSLCRTAALVMIDFRLAQAASAVRSFWDSEREFLKSRLPQEQFEELTRIYSESVAQ